MRYVRCLNNKSYVHFRGQPLRDETLASLTIGRVYKALPPTEDERRLGELRIIDNEGEDYLYPTEYFETVLFPTTRKPDETATIHLDALTKAILWAEATAARKSISALLRDWIDERLDLPA